MWEIRGTSLIPAGSAQPPKATHPRCSLFPPTQWDCAGSELGAVSGGICPHVLHLRGVGIATIQPVLMDVALSA